MVTFPVVLNGVSIVMPSSAAAVALPSVEPAFFTAASMKRIAVAFSHDQLVG